MTGLARSDTDTERLGAVISANVILTSVSGAFTLVMGGVVRLAWLAIAGVAVLATAGAQYAALRTVRSGNLPRALLYYSLASWSIALLSTLIVTFQWPVQVAVAFLPTVLAATFMPDRRMGPYIVGSGFVAVGVAVLGVAQDVTGLSEDIPDWLKTLVQVLIFPGFTALVVLAIMQHHRRVNELLAVERDARELARDRATELAASRRRLIQATDRARQEIERDLHDGAQSHLIGIDLQLVRAMSLDDLESTRAAIRSVQHELQRAHAELRELAHGLFPPVLDQHGLVPAIREALDRFPDHVRLDAEAIGRSDPDVEAACYFYALEAMQNAVKHSGASSIEVALALVDGAEIEVDTALQVTVTDDGRGIDGEVPTGHGLDNMRDRLGAVGGAVEFVTRSTRGTRGTRVVATAPWPGQRR